VRNLWRRPQSRTWIQAVSPRVAVPSGVLHPGGEPLVLSGDRSNSQTLSRAVGSAVLWTTFWLLLVARVLWDWHEPVVEPDQVSTLFRQPWIRNVLLLVPAACVALTAIVCFSAPRPQLRIWSRFRAMRRRQQLCDPYIALLLALWATCTCVAINLAAFRGQVQIQDDTNYLFQAKIFSHARLWTDPPPTGAEEFFRFPYVMTTHDKWFGSFFPGQSFVLMVGVLIDRPFVVNPILTGILVWLTYWAGGRMFNRTCGVIAAALMAVSPFALFQGASFMSHVVAAVCSTVAATWILTAEASRRWSFLGAGAALGFLLLSRPLSAALLALYGLVWGLGLCWGRQRTARDTVSQILLTAIGMIPFAVIQGLYNYALTGYPLVTPHQLALPNEYLGIGIHSLTSLAVNGFSLSQFLFGVPALSLLPLGAYALLHPDRWSRPIVVLMGVFALGYAIYPYHGAYFGPRFYYDIAPFLFIGSARGLVGISRDLARLLGDRRAVHCVVSWCAIQAVVAFVGFMPPYFLQTRRLADYLEIEGLVRKTVQPAALVLISDPQSNSYASYLAGFRLNPVDLSGPILYARNLGERNAELMKAFPQRYVYCLDIRARTIISCDQRQIGQANVWPEVPDILR
jgi:4-amino-4-deoxy-L-arabinose transferase-like glycosyltransferase